MFLKGDMALCKEGRLDSKLQVESPLNPLDDVGSSARNYSSLVKRHFKLALDLLKTRGFTSESILKLIISPEMFEAHED